MLLDRLTKVGVLLFICLFFWSCENPFATRNPEPPVTNQSQWIQPTSPIYVIINLQNAIAERNIANYLQCLADTSVASKQYSFYPEPAVANANPGLFARWSKQQESNYLQQLNAFLPKDSTASVTFERLNETSLQDSVILLQNYKLKVHYKCPAGDCPRDMQGQAEFRLVRSADDFWYIYRWSDFATGDEPTWSELKAKFGKL